MRLLIECNYVFTYPHHNSGIQRVVRNVIKNLENIDSEYECIPVIFKRGSVFRVNRLKPSKFDAFLAKIKDIATAARQKHWESHARWHQRKPFTGSRRLRQIVTALYLVTSVWHMLPLMFFHLLNRYRIDHERARELEVKPSDVLVLLDSSWHSNFFNDVEKLKRQGIKAYAVVYDLIPLTHPQFCDAGLVMVFEKWFEWISAQADGFICISKTVRDNVQHFIQEKQIDSNATFFDHFYLGTDLDLSNKEDDIAEQLKSVFNSKDSVYLMVSTIEPRKNHAYLIDAFELLWEQNSNATLCIVGVIGWRCDDLIKRIQNHSELGRRLFMFNNLSDSELGYCYQHATSLVFPSFVEGFGLPLIEAQERGLPAMASDIPVFREIGGNSLRYFDLDDPASLATLISNTDQETIKELKSNLNDWSWMSWRDATQELISKLVGHANRF